VELELYLSQSLQLYLSPPNLINEKESLIRIGVAQQDKYHVDVLRELLAIAYLPIEILHSIVRDYLTLVGIWVVFGYLNRIGGWALNP
jgi:hypothetical protein